MIINPNRIELFIRGLTMLIEAKRVPCYYAVHTFEDVGSNKMLYTIFYNHVMIINKWKDDNQAAQYSIIFKHGQIREEGILIVDYPEHQLLLDGLLDIGYKVAQPYDMNIFVVEDIIDNVILEVVT